MLHDSWSVAPLRGLVISGPSVPPLTRWASIFRPGGLGSCSLKRPGLLARALRVPSSDKSGTNNEAESEIRKTGREDMSEVRKPAGGENVRKYPARGEEMSEVREPRRGQNY